MNKFKLIVLTCFICTEFTAQVNQQKVDKNATVKKSATEQSVLFTISGKVTKTRSYCGGRRPTEEKLDEIEKPRPYVGKKFHLRKGNSNSIASPVVFSFTTNDSGVFSFELPPGLYAIIQNAQVKEIDMKDYQTNEYIHADEKCLRQWWPIPYYVLEVKDKSITDLKFTFHHECTWGVRIDIPCLHYSGPMPP